MNIILSATFILLVLLIFTYLSELWLMSDTRARMASRHHLKQMKRIAELYLGTMSDEEYCKFLERFEQDHKRHLR